MMQEKLEIPEIAIRELLLNAINIDAAFLLPREQKWIKWAVGFAMIPRGEVGLIFAEVGLKNKILDNELYATMVIVIAITTIFTLPFEKQA